MSIAADYLNVSMKGVTAKKEANFVLIVPRSFRYSNATLLAAQVPIAQAGSVANVIYF